MHVVVIGGGVVGVTTALELNGAGHEVTVVDSRPGPGQGTSYANAGLVTAGHAEVWAGPSAPRTALKGWGRASAPVRFRLLPDPGQWRWMARFLRNCTEERWQRHSRLSIRLSAYSLSLLQALRAETGIDYDHQDKGLLMISQDARVLEGWHGLVDLVRGEGLAAHLLDGPACLDIEPALARSTGTLAGGIHFPGDESGDCHRFTLALAARCANQGVVFRHGEEVIGLRREGSRLAALRTRHVGSHRPDGEETVIEADHYVLAAGPQSPLLTRQVGLRLPIHPIKGYSATFYTDGSENIPTVSLSHLDHKMAVSRLGERLRCAGTAEFAGYDLRMDTRRMDTLLRNARLLVPEGLEVEAVETWCGLRPATPDGLPIVGPTPLDNFTLNTGHGSMGWTMACATARMVRASLEGLPPEFPFEGLTLARFQ